MLPFPLAAAAPPPLPLDPCFQSAADVLSADNALSVADYCGASVSGCLFDRLRAPFCATNRKISCPIFFYDYHHFI